jgi:hypothetical protein
LVNVSSLAARRATQFHVSRTCHEVIVDHTGRLHQRVADRAFAITALIFYTVFAGIAFLLEKRRSEPDWQKVDS